MYEDWGSSQILNVNVGGTDKFTRLTVHNPVAQILNINAEVYSERMFPRKSSCDPRTQMYIWLENSQRQEIGDYEGIHWSGVASVGSETQPLPAGTYKFVVQNNRWESGNLDLTLGFYAKNQAITVDGQTLQA